MEELSNKAKELQREYYRKWRANNKEKLKEINQRYWLKKAQNYIERGN